MAEHFLHGVEVIELDGGARPIQSVASSVIGLVGTAPKGPVNTPTLILGSRAEAVKIFGEDMEGYTIPAALDAIFDQAGAMVVVVNVADPNNPAHKSPIITETRTFDANGEIFINAEGIGDLEVRNHDGVRVYERDYTFDPETRIISWVDGGYIAFLEELQISYTRFGDNDNPMEADRITLSDVIGGVNADGTYRGAQCLLAAQSECKVQPRILVAPGFTHQRPQGGANPVVSKLIEIAERMRATIIADCPNETKEAAVDYREDWGSPRVYCAYPWVKIMKGESIIDEPASPRIAGLIAKSDNERGFWWSPSNSVINGIVGISKPIDFTLGDPVCVANFLNENKVATIIQQDGFRLWGNRTCSADAKWCFISVRRTADMINDSLLRAHLWAVDRNITKTYCEDVSESVNNYLRYLKNIGAIIGGQCWVDKTLNAPDQIQQGKIIFDFDFTAPYPAEHITFRSRLVSDYLEEIFE
jgi:phage tail sheath protein FI